MFTFLHASDLHLDTPVGGVVGHSMPASVAESLRDASILAWDALVDAAIAHGVDFVVLAGGVYDGPENGLRAQLCLRDGLARLGAAGIRSFVALGHSDAAPPGWTAIDAWPEGTHVFAGAGPTGSPVESVTIEVGGEAVTVHGVSNAARDLPDDIVARFPSKRSKGFHVGLLHIGHGTGAPAVADLQARSIHYWALGGSHNAAVHGSEPWMVEPGTIQGRSATALAERGPKGAFLVTVDGGKVAEPRPVALDLVRFVTASVDIGELHTVTELIDRLQEAADPGAHDGRSVVVRATVTGTGPLHEEVSDPANVARILKTLNASSSATPFAWFDRVEWRTRPTIDLDEVRQGTDFLSDLLATADAPPESDDWRAALPKLPADVLRLLDDPIHPADASVASRALDLALNEFAGGQP
jgi:exonuclease SbcD